MTLLDRVAAVLNGAGMTHALIGAAALESLPRELADLWKRIVGSDHRP